MSYARSIWRDMHQNEISELAVCIHRDALDVHTYCFQRKFNFAKTLNELRELTKSWGRPLPHHLYGLGEAGLRELAVQSNERRDQAYIDACRQAAENYLWGVFLAQSCSDSLDLPTEFEEAL